ncbi:hypothetical protein M404DRAFT_617246 [Pisolithus tinctorius Marx 270]|uniref:Uncharacterized protein n=1 Tax=Pisolithus tinctorius Marx 270 TaxID=870435 RepID=A0A0C3NBN9_PISTI|nr:hypothetical protein M404DRAFT_617246 [Pisolithus tinctorius Marx 270]
MKANVDRDCYALHTTLHLVLHLHRTQASSLRPNARAGGKSGTVNVDKDKAPTW